MAPLAQEGRQAARHALESQYRGAPSRIYRRRGARAAGTLTWPSSVRTSPRSTPQRSSVAAFPDRSASRPIFPHCVQCVRETHSGNTLAQKDIPRTHAPARVRSFWINGDKHDEKACPIAAAVLSTRKRIASRAGRRYAKRSRVTARARDRGAAGAASSFRPGRSSEVRGNWLSVAAGMRRGGSL